MMLFVLHEIHFLKPHSQHLGLHAVRAPQAGPGHHRHGPAAPGHGLGDPLARAAGQMSRHHGTAIYADQLTPSQPPQLIGIYMAVPLLVVFGYITAGGYQEDSRVSLSVLFRCPEERQTRKTEHRNRHPSEEPEQTAAGFESDPGILAM